MTFADDVWENSSSQQLQPADPSLPANYAKTKRTRKQQSGTESKTQSVFQIAQREVKGDTTPID